MATIARPTTVQKEMTHLRQQQLTTPLYRVAATRYKSVLRLAMELQCMMK